MASSGNHCRRAASSGQSATCDGDQNSRIQHAIADFLELGRQLQSARSLAGAVVLERLTTWYRSDRIRRAELQDDGDMLLLQWGAIRPPLLPLKGITVKVNYCG